jgi:hypothetical protein
MNNSRKDKFNHKKQHFEIVTGTRMKKKLEDSEMKKELKIKVVVLKQAT